MRVFLCYIPIVVITRSLKVIRTSVAIYLSYFLQLASKFSDEPMESYIFYVLNLDMYDLCCVYKENIVIVTLAQKKSQ